MKKTYIAPAATIYSIKPSSVIVTSPQLISTTTLTRDDFDNDYYEID